VKSAVDEQLRREVSKFVLRYTCDSCAHFDPEVGACGNGFPTAPHRDVDLARDREIVFCKLFELA
jgi:hypothetical protein